MYSRLLVPPAQKSFFLFGPRGVGKTTWVRQTFPRALYVDLLEPVTFNQLIARPQELEKVIPKTFSDWIIIDEIQRIPELLNQVHRLIELRKYRFLLTGSSARKLRKMGHNLLAGRALVYRLHPLTAIELGGDFDMQHMLQFGGLPGVFGERDKKKFLESYVQTYLQEEIQQEGITRNLGGFARFLETASFSQGSVLNVSAVAREAMVERKVVESYFIILEDLLTAVRIPVFSKKAKRKLVAHTKFYFFDTGIYRTIRPKGPLDGPEAISGVTLESLFFQNLRAINDYFNLGYTLYYYRTATGVEVDFIAYGEKGLVAFEIKSKKDISSDDLYGLTSFINDYPMAKGIMVYGGDHKKYDKGIEIWPMKEALLNLPALLGL